jgi:hypothetical protein
MECACENDISAGRFSDRMEPQTVPSDLKTL